MWLVVLKYKLYSAESLAATLCRDALIAVHFVFLDNNYIISLTLPKINLPCSLNLGCREKSHSFVKLKLQSLQPTLSYRVGGKSQVNLHFRSPYAKFVVKFKKVNITLTEYIIGGIVGVLAIVQLLYLYIVYNAPRRRGIAERKGKLSLATHQPGISVVITASDQEMLLAKHLPRILEQDYPNFEVIVVDDNSMDDTKELLERMAIQHPNLYMTYTSDSIRYISHKKLALTLGIKAAKNDWVVFIEPDCYPVSKQWLTQLARHCTDSTDVVLGYSNYERKPGFANLCYMYDTLLQQLRMLGLTLRGKGYMGIGRNMAYRRELFFTNKGYSRHLDLERGEDDLFVNEHVASGRITADISAESVVRCTSTSARAWQTDKLIRLFIRRKMHGMAPCLLEGDTLTRVLLYIAAIVGVVVGIVSHGWWLVGTAIALWLVVIGCRILVLHHAAQELGERRYNVSTLLFDIIHPCWELYFRLCLRLMPKDMHMRRKV